MNPQTKAKLITIGILIILTLTFFIGSKTKEMNILSKCYTNLQPSTYFTKTPISSVTTNDLKGYLKMDYKGDSLNTSQVLGTNSMKPLMARATILIHYKPNGNVNVGDIIIFKRQTDDKKIAHRVIRIENNSFITKGDNNFKEDDYKVRFEDIEGIVVGVLW